MRVLVTRPQPGARKTAEKLKGLGFDPVVLPLTRIEALRPVEWPDKIDHSALAITSPNAARHAPEELLSRIRHLPAYAVGTSTGAEARSRGLTVVDEGAGDAARMVDIVAGSVAAGAAVLILCGRLRRNVLEQGLLDAGLRPNPVETYDTIPLKPTQVEADRVLGGVPVEAGLFYSAAAAEQFSGLHDHGATRQLLSGMTPIAISARVADCLPASFRRRARIAREPTEEAMLSLL